MNCLVKRHEWMLCMRLALTELVEDLELRDGLIRAFSHMADHLIKQVEANGMRQISNKTAQNTMMGIHH